MRHRNLRDGGIILESRQEEKETAAPENKKDGGTSGIAGKRWLTKGIYGSKDVPVRILDGLILGVFVTIIVLVIAFAINGGYPVTFDTAGGSEVGTLKLRYGNKIKEPEVPKKPGYVFDGWMTSEDEMAERWDFDTDTVEGEMTLYAAWKPAQITIKFDLNGGVVNGAGTIADIQIPFGMAYGELPVPEKKGYLFDGWEYGGNIILPDTSVTTSGEHILKARWLQMAD